MLENQITVNIPLSEYNKLKEFKENIQENYTYLVHNGYYNTEIISTDEAIKEIISINKKLKEKLSEKRLDRENIIDEIKNMSVLKFIQWRKNPSY